MSNVKPNNSARVPLLDEEASQDVAVVKTEAPEAPKKDNSKALVISFLLMVFIGLGNKIFQVLEFIPMNNYPLFINLLTTFVYIPASFAYVFPMLKWGKMITKESLEIPQYKWAIMGFLDSVCGIMQSLAVNYVSNGSLVTLLTQSAIPSSMIISYVFLKTRYKLTQYVGAVIVAVGIVIVLWPEFSGKSNNQNAHNSVAWSLVLIASCIPMCLSSVYKEKALGDADIDPIYLNGWVAVYQFIFSIPLLIPSAIASSVSIHDLPNNLWNGMRCLARIDSQFEPKGNLIVDNCHWGTAYVLVYIMFNLGYNVLIILIIKFGSSNILWLAMTVMVPLANFSFALPFMPRRQSITWEDVVGLVVIMFGLLTYRFYDRLKALFDKYFAGGETEADKKALAAASPSMATPIRGTTKHVGKAKPKK